MTVTHLTSVSQLNGILSKSNDTLSVIDFHATWCGPCHAIAPTFESLAKQYPGVNFLKCDVDAARDVAALYKVSAMPTFIFLKGSNQVHKIQGADRMGLQNAVKQLASSSAATGAFSGQGHTLGSSSPPVDVTGGASALWSNMDPQFKVLLALLAAYAFFWLM
ncbi:thioredoxin-like protein [Melanogaster broomeanus]|nr:thioredoxin-like protein [Melanogaster broomeanus]